MIIKKHLLNNAKYVKEFKEDCCDISELDDEDIKEHKETVEKYLV